jgi:hypothetical protein
MLWYTVLQSRKTITTNYQINKTIMNVARCGCAFCSAGVIYVSEYLGWVCIVVCVDGWMDFVQEHQNADAKEKSKENVVRLQKQIQTKQSNIL